jgi:tetratricopeptide (TPR) repeat protein
MNGSIMNRSKISLLPLTTAPARGLRPRARWWLVALAALAFACGGDVESRMAEVRALQDVGQFAASIEELREILAITPDLAEANYRLGMALVQTGEPSRAVWPLQKAADSSQYEITAGILLASTHFQTKNYDESIRAANRVLEIDPDRQAALRIRAQAYLSARNLEAAIEDTTRLKDLYPDDYGVRALHATVLADLGRLEEAEKEHHFVKELGQESDDPQFRVRACLSPAVFAKEVLRDDEKARPFYEDCASRNPTDPVALNHILAFFDGIGERERGTQMVRDAAASAPENLSLQQSLANRLAATDDPEGAEEVLKGTVDSFGSAAAWQGLAQFYRVRKQPEKALEALAKVTELSGGGNDSLRFTQADLLIDTGDLEGARAVADQIKQPTYLHLIRGRIELLSGNPEAALASFEQGINAWPQNAGARYLAGLAARDLGDFDRAVSELREAVRAGNAETEAAIEVARILLSLGRYNEAATFANMSLGGPSGKRQSAAYIVGARAYMELGQYDRGRGAIQRLVDLGYPALAARELALLTRAESGPAAAVSILENSDLDLTNEANLEPLRQLTANLISLRRGHEAVRHIDAALAANPGNLDLIELRGLTLAQDRKFPAAREALEQVLAEEPDRPLAVAGLAMVTANQGDFAQAIVLFDRAYALDRSNGQPAHMAAQISLASGDEADAIERLRHLVVHHPEIVAAPNDLAWLLAESGEDLDYALELAQRARERSAAPQIIDTLGWVHLKRGDAEQAVELLEEALAGRPQSPSIRYHLGVALGQAGQKERAREMLEAAIGGPPFGELDQARDALAKLDG